MRIKLTSILVDDQEKALKFYTDVFGFVKKHDIPVGEYRWITVVSPEGPADVELALEPNANPVGKTVQAGNSRDGLRGLEHRAGISAPSKPRRGVHARTQARGTADDRNLRRYLQEPHSVVRAATSITSGEGVKTSNGRRGSDGRPPPLASACALVPLRLTPLILGSRASERPRPCGLVSTRIGGCPSRSRVSVEH